MLSYTKSNLISPQDSIEKEWLITNGLGSFASGTISSVVTRRYHGLLIAALNPPVERTLLLTKLDETIQVGGQKFALLSNWFKNENHAVYPDNTSYLESFFLDGTTPVWIYAIQDIKIEKRIWMQQGENTTFIQYKYLSGSPPINIKLAAMVNNRDFHSNTQPEEWQMKIMPTEKGISLHTDPKQHPLYLFCEKGKFESVEKWVPDFYHHIENYRGEQDLDANYHSVDIHATLNSGDCLTVIASTKPTPNLDVDLAWQEKQDYEKELLTSSQFENQPNWIQQLVLAADQFIVQRTIAGDKKGHSVIAGYPWFADWGRDTMIALQGLTLTTKRFELAASILRTFAEFVDQGMLPNRFPDEGEEPEYNTIDATLWYFQAVYTYYQETNDTALIRELYPILQEIVLWHERGTRYGIKVDSKDGLITGGEPNVQLTWMDAKVDDWVVTPREGKAVEINALWFNALNIMQEFSQLINDKSDYQQRTNQVQESFQKFWNPEKGYCFDVLESSKGNDPALRPNQLFAISLSHSPLTQTQQKAIVDVCEAYLLTPHGLRSLAPQEKEYVGLYGGSRYIRDGAYHQGTTWGWLIGPFVRAHYQVYQDQAKALGFIQPFERHLSEHGVGSLSEVFDGDAPFTPRGCIAQAWSVAEVLAIWQLIK